MPVSAATSERIVNQSAERRYPSFEDKPVTAINAFALV
jgi:hypothetical protein